MVCPDSLQSALATTPTFIPFAGSFLVEPPSPLAQTTFAGFTAFPARSSLALMRPNRAFASAAVADARSVAEQAFSWIGWQGCSTHRRAGGEILLFHLRLRPYGRQGESWPSNKIWQRGNLDTGTDADQPESSQRGRSCSQSSAGRGGAGSLTLLRG